VQWGRILKWIGIALAAMLVFALVGGWLLLRSDAFHRYAVRKIEEQAAQSTGAAARIGSLDWNFSTLTADLHDIVLRGKEGDAQPPLLHVDELKVSVKILSVFHRKFSLSELDIRRPVVHMQVDAQGNTNLPTPPPNRGSSNTSVFDLAIRHFVLSKGEIYYNDQKTPMDASLDDVESEIAFNSLTTSYHGNLSYGNGSLHYAQYAPLTHRARLEFAASPSKFSLSSASLQTGASSISLKADVTNFANPLVVGNYEVSIHAQDFAAMSPGMKPSGDIRTTGSLHYQSEGQPSALRSLALSGDLESGGFAALTAQGKLDIQKLNARYELANGNLRVYNVDVRSLGGQITAEADVRELDATPQGRIHAGIHAVSLRALQMSAPQALRQQVALSGTLDGSADATWIGSFANLRGRSDLYVRGGAKNNAGNSGDVPVDAAIHAAYDGRSDTITLRQTSLRTTSLTVTAEGQISKHSRLQIQAQSDDLQQLVKLASSFSPNASAPPAISGAASLSASVEGSLRQPKVSGQLTAQNVSLQASEWKKVAASFTASPSEINVRNGLLQGAKQGQATFDAKISLRDWSYSPNSPIQANLSVDRMPINDLQRLANVHYPASGDLSAKVTMHGSQNDPSGSGSARVVNANIYGEPLKTLELKFEGANGSITSHLTVSAPAGTLNSSLTYSPKSKRYRVSLDAHSITLEKLHALASSRDVKGTLNASVSGEGTVDDPQLAATVEIPKLEVQQKSIAGLKADVKVANQKATLNLDSQVAQATVRGHALIGLTGDYPAEAAIDTGEIPLESLLAAVSSSAPEGLKGATELHATLRGPLKEKTKMEAHLTVSKFDVSYQQLQIGAAKPIQADYAGSVLTVQPAEIRGTGTSLKVSGSVPFGGSGTPNLTAQGTIDVRILKLMQPDLESSGTVELDVRAAGSSSAPEVQGQVRLQNVAISTTAGPLGMEKLNGTLDLSSDRVQISNMTAQVGGGQVSLGGAITYKPSVQFALALQSKSIRLRYPTGLRTILDGNLGLNGNLQASTLAGRILVDSLSFTPDFDIATFGDQFSSSAATPSQPGFADSVRLNIAIQSKDNLSATSSQVSIEGNANLSVSGTAADPVVTGRTELTAGELFYRGNRYQLQRGVITFADPNRTNPNLNVSVATTVEQYNLTVNMRGTLDRLTTTYQSDPPLSSADVIHLLAFGNTTSEAAASSASQSTDSMLASGALGAGLSSGAQKLAGLSSIQIDPLLGGNNQNPSARIALQQRVSKNFLFTFSTDVSQPGAEIVQGDYQINKRWSVNVTRDQLGGVTVAGRLHTKF